jgi:hypothetical protein
LVGQREGTQPWCVNEFGNDKCNKKTAFQNVHFDLNIIEQLKNFPFCSP